MHKPTPLCDSFFMNNDEDGWENIFVDYDIFMHEYYMFLDEINSDYNGPLYELPHKCADVLSTWDTWVHIRNPMDFPMNPIQQSKSKRWR